MENSTPSNRIHPLVAGAAISVMLVSLTGVAAITGLLPSSHSTGAPADTPPAAATAAGTALSATAAASPAALVESKAPAAEPQAKAAPEKPRSQPTRVARTEESTSRAPRTYSSTPANVAAAPAICYTCGRVESVNEIQQAAPPSGVGMVAGAVLGGVLGNQVGGGNGRKLATVAGAIGGGYAGNEVEKRTRGTTTYSVRVRMEDGEIRTFPYEQQPGWGVGDRVKVVNGQLTSRA